MTVMERVFNIVGGKAEVAQRLGLHRQQVEVWDIPPIKYVRRLSAMTNGKISENQLLRAILDKKAV